MVKVKLTHPFPDWPFLRQTPGGLGQWEDYQFFVNQTEVESCDFWVVCDGLLSTETAVCPPQNTIFVTWEPPAIKRYSAKFLAQFAAVITCQREVQHRDVIYLQQAHPWFVGKSYDELKGADFPVKSKMMSVVCSDKQFTEGHRKRFEFAHNLKAHFGDAVDLFGRGIRDFDDKWEVLAPYKYSVAIENLVYADWLTEKMPDCFLAGTFPFYYGCPNIEKYFDPRAYNLIDTDDFARSVKIIEAALSSDEHYQNHRAALVEAKNAYLDVHSLFPMLTTVLKNRIARGDNTPKRMQIRPPSAFGDSLLYRVQRKIKSRFDGAKEQKFR